MNPRWLMPLVLFVTGVMIGWATTGLMESYMPLMINAAAYFWQALGLGWFMVLFGGLALGMILVFDRW